MVDQPFVRLEVSKTKRIKLKFGHRELRNAALSSKRPVGELILDPFGGWPFLIAEAHRPWDSTMSLDKASDYIGEWVQTPDPGTGEQRSLEKLGDFLSEAMKKAWFKPSTKTGDDDDGDAEGNGQQEAATPGATTPTS